MSDIKSFSKVEDLIKTVVAYPRRVKYSDNPDCFGFEADDGMQFTMSWFDYYNISQGQSHRVRVFDKAVKNKNVEEYCESLNYGKPDFEEK